MPRDEDLIHQLLNLEPNALAEVLSRVGDAKGWPLAPHPAWLSGIESTPGVCGGEPCIVRTRIPVWLLERMRRLAVPEADILSSYPTLRAVDLVNAWSYATSHPAEIDRQIRENEEA